MIEQREGAARLGDLLAADGVEGVRALSGAVVSLTCSRLEPDAPAVAGRALAQDAGDARAAGDAFVATCSRASYWSSTLARVGGDRAAGDSHGLTCKLRTLAAPR